MTHQGKLVRDKHRHHSTPTGALSANTVPTAERISHSQWQVCGATGMAGRLTLRAQNPLSLDALDILAEHRSAGLLLREIHLSAGGEPRVTMRYEEKSGVGHSTAEIPENVAVAQSLLRRILRGIPTRNRADLIMLCCHDTPIFATAAVPALEALVNVLSSLRQGRDAGLLAFMRQTRE